MACFHPLARACAAMLLVGTAACAGTPGAFSPRYPDNAEGDLRELVQRVQAAPERRPLPIAVGVTPDAKVFAYDLAARHVLWQFPAHARFAPQLAGTAVVLQEGERVIGIDLKTGAQRFQFDAQGMHLVGADGDGNACVVAMTSGRGTYAKSRLVFMRGDTRQWVRTLNDPLGVPALVGEVVLAPWSTQYLSGLEAQSGDEFARLRLRDGVVSHAFARGGHVYAGSQHGVAQLTPSIIAANIETLPHYTPPDRELPGRPLLLRDAYARPPLPAPDSAQNRIRLAFAPADAAGKRVPLAGNNLYLVFYRFVFALDPNDLALHWVYRSDVDLVGARAQQDGLLVADERGEIRYLGAHSGATRWLEKNAPPSVDLEFPADLNPTGASESQVVSPQVLRQQLAAAARDPDSRLVPVRLLAVDLLAQLSDPAATQDLVQLCDDDRTTVGVRKAACNALRKRTTGAEYVLAALRRHAAYLDGTEAPAVGALATAAATEHDTRATPLLIAHLRDPNTPTQGLPELVRALGELNDPSAVPALSAFLLLYHADPVDEHLAQAVALAPAVLAKLQGQDARATLEKVAADALGTGNVQDSSRQALAKLDALARAPDEAAQAAVRAEQEAAAKAAAEKEKEQAPRLPPRITLDLVNQVLLPVHDQLHACVRDATPPVFQARVILAVEDGQVMMVSVLPDQLQSCIEPLIRSQKFPLTQLSQRDTISYVIKRF